jgi:hypothetical protein
MAATTHKPPTGTDVSDSTATARSGSPFVKIVSWDALSRQIICLEIYHGANQKIGTIDDIAYRMTGIEAFIVGARDVFGMGDHYVAIQPSAISLCYSRADKKRHSVINMNVDQLKGARTRSRPSWPSEAIATYY